MAPTQLTEPQWAEYEELGYLNLGQVVSNDEMEALRTRIDDIMLGDAKIDYDRILMQLDAGGEYGNLGAQSKGHKGSTLEYRKIQDLEFDPLFLRYMQLPIFEDICRRVYGDKPIGCFRAMFMNKPANKGTLLPWHQDAWSYLDRQPEITLWTALDAATVENGCVQIIPGSHKLDRINPEHSSGFLTEQQAAEHCPEDKIVHLELKQGEVALLHNWVLHCSDVNRTDAPRRGFSVCYMDGDTQHIGQGQAANYTTIFGEGALTPEKLEVAATT